MATKKAAATAQRDRKIAAVERIAATPAPAKAAKRAQGPGIVPGNGGLSTPRGALTWQSPTVKAAQRKANWKGVSDEVAHQDRVQRNMAAIDVARFKRPAKKVKAVRDSGTGEFTTKARAKADPKGTVTETLAPRAKGGRAKPLKKAAEPRYYLVESTRPDFIGEGESLTKGELLAQLAEEIEHLPLDERQGKSVPFGIPTTIGAAVDLLFTTRQKRLEYDHKSSAMKVHETALKDHLINTLPKSDATGGAGKLARAQIKTESQPVVTDWEAFYGYIAKKKEFDLLNRAVNRKAVKARWDNGKAIPGVGTFEVVKVSMERIGGGDA